MKKLFFLMAASFLFAPVHAQITERERPAEWQHLVKGARFMDRFLPMPDGIQIKGIWGTDSVLNRYVDNGIELPGVSFWGGNILQDTDGKYHLFVCGWPEDSPKGHMFWSNSTLAVEVKVHFRLADATLLPSASSMLYARTQVMGLSLLFITSTLRLKIPFWYWASKGVRAKKF